MKDNRENIQNRRQLLTGTLRGVALAILGAVTGSVAAKRRRLVRENKCINNSICRGCKVYPTCPLPQALSAKEVLVNKGS